MAYHIDTPSRKFPDPKIGAVTVADSVYERLQERADKRRKEAARGVPVMDMEALQEACRRHHGYESPELNEKLYLHFKGFRRIENLEKFVNLKSLFLESNGIGVIEGLPASLRCLQLHQNVIRSISGLAHCQQLVTLNLAQNSISRLEGLAELPALATLNVSKNRLRERVDIEHIQHCSALTNLDVSANELGSGAHEWDGESQLPVSSTGGDALAVIPGSNVGSVSGSGADTGSGLTLALALLDTFRLPPKLTSLKLEGNPFVRSIPHYRKTAINRLPRLNWLDRPIFELERRAAYAWQQGGREAELAEREAYQKEKRDAERAKMLRYREWKEGVRQRRRRELEAQRIAANDGSSNVSDEQQGGDGAAPDPEANNNTAKEDEDNSASVAVATSAGTIGWGGSEQSARMLQSRQSPVVTPAPATRADHDGLGGGDQGVDEDEDNDTQIGIMDLSDGVAEVLQHRSTDGEQLGEAYMAGDGVLFDAVGNTQAKNEATSTQYFTSEPLPATLDPVLASTTQTGTGGGIGCHELEVEDEQKEGGGPSFADPAVEAAAAQLRAAQLAVRDAEVAAAAAAAEAVGAQDHVKQQAEAEARAKAEARRARREGQRAASRVEAREADQRSQRDWAVQESLRIYFSDRDAERERKAQKHERQGTTDMVPPLPPPPTVISTASSSGEKPSVQLADNSAWHWSPAVDAQLIQSATDSRFDFAVVAEKLCRVASDTNGAGCATVSSLQCRLRYAQLTDAKEKSVAVYSGSGSSEHASKHQGRQQYQASINSGSATAAQGGFTDFEDLD